MARTPPNLNFADEPTIIVDPSLYVPEPRGLLVAVCETFVEIARAVVVAALAGTTVLSVAHVLGHNSLTDRASARESAPPSLRIAELMAEVNERTPAVADSLRASAEPSAGAQAPTLSDEPATPALAEPVHAAIFTGSQPDVAAALDLTASVRAGRRLLALHRLDQAEAAFREVLAVRSNLPAALSGLARVHLARRELDQALALAQRAVDLAPQHMSYHLTLGDVLRVSGQPSAADAQFELAMRLSAKRADESGRAMPANPL